MNYSVWLGDAFLPHLRLLRLFVITTIRFSWTTLFLYACRRVTARYLRQTFTRRWNATFWVTPHCRSYPTQHLTATAHYPPAWRALLPGAFAGLAWTLPAHDATRARHLNGWNGNCRRCFVPRVGFFPTCTNPSPTSPRITTLVPVAAALRIAVTHLYLRRRGCLHLTLVRWHRDVVGWRTLPHGRNLCRA